MTEAKGWAVIDNGKILVETVSPTRRAAIANWLVTERMLMVQADASDMHIDLWCKFFKDIAECCEVNITKAQEATDDQFPEAAQ